MAQATNERRRIEIAQINAALGRMDADEFGYCVGCGDEIMPKQLELNPAIADVWSARPRAFRTRCEEARRSVTTRHARISGSFSQGYSTRDASAICYSASWGSMKKICRPICVWQTAYKPHRLTLVA